MVVIRRKKKPIWNDRHLLENCLEDNDFFASEDNTTSIKRHSHHVDTNNANSKNKNKYKNTDNNLIHMKTSCKTNSNHNRDDDNNFYKHGKEKVANISHVRDIDIYIIFFIHF